MAKRSVKEGKETRSGEEVNAVRKKRAPFKRLVMRQEDRDTIRRNLMFGFRCWGASEEQALKSITNGSHGGMEVWIQRWITHNTDYVTSGMTEDVFRAGLFAWVYYKATAEVPAALKPDPEMKEMAERFMRNRIAAIDKERESNDSSDH